MFRVYFISLTVEPRLNATKVAWEAALPVQ